MEDVIVEGVVGTLAENLPELFCVVGREMNLLVTETVGNACTEVFAEGRIPPTSKAVGFLLTSL
ncbi:hypothetical protein GCM10009037_31100 [Halarchaeum grantii]|uniref:Uncharacterized protein n=1 Tax=Halarchaeum grantii TaxID=1193105 RepID=A0A830F6G4_9EURY|nr:hypothetical protein [Halarchaeum grantii]GGL45434.1 hypothetical protein GCM10009037_31100 [Halarchaeum grantii]